MFTITQLAKAFGLKASALRYHESAGLLAPAIRVGGRRVYDESARLRLSFIVAAQTSGLTLKEILAMIERGEAGESPRQLWPEVVARKVGQLDQKIAELTAMRSSLIEKASCRCKTLAACERRLSRVKEA